jgi:hypothetical protein
MSVQIELVQKATDEVVDAVRRLLPQLSQTALPPDPEHWVRTPLAGPKAENVDEFRHHSGLALRRGRSGRAGDPGQRAPCTDVREG